MIDISTISHYYPKNLIFKISETKKKEGVYCCAYGCKSNPIYKKNGMCHKHYARYRKMIDPVYDRYFNFKYNALRRCKDFTVTLEQFRQYCKDNNYIIQKGNRGRAMTVDRKDNRFGYHIWNLQPMSGRANTKKYHEVDKHLDLIPEGHEDYVPF